MWNIFDVPAYFSNCNVFSNLTEICRIHPKRIFTFIIQILNLLMFENNERYVLWFWIWVSFSICTMFSSEWIIFFAINIMVLLIWCSILGIFSMVKPFRVSLCRWRRLVFLFYLHIFSYCNSYKTTLLQIMIVYLILQLLHYNLLLYNTIW